MKHILSTDTILSDLAEYHILLTLATIHCSTLSEESTIVLIHGSCQMHFICKKEKKKTNHSLSS